MIQVDSAVITTEGTLTARHLRVTFLSSPKSFCNDYTAAISVITFLTVCTVSQETNARGRVHRNSRHADLGDSPSNIGGRKLSVL